MQTTLKKVGTSGQLTLGKRYAGRHFQVEERSSGDLLLTPVRVVPDRDMVVKGDPAAMPAFRIAEVEQVVMPSREQRNARRG